jgi:hypothetical protein
MMTVVLTEQIGSEDNFSIVQVMDVPLPPTVTQVVPTGLVTAIEVSEAPEKVLAWFSKELPARGWTAGRQSASDGVKGAEFRKAGRAITVNARPAGGGSAGSSIQLIHMAAMQ